MPDGDVGYSIGTGKLERSPAANMPFPNGILPLLGATWDAVPHRVSQSQAQEFLDGRYGAVEELRPLGGGFWSSAYSFCHAGRELVLRLGANKDWFEADRAAMAFASLELPVPEVVEIGDAFDGAYAISVRHYGTNLEDLRPDQSDATGPMLASLLAALFKVPKTPDLPVGWYWQPRRSDLTWRGWLSEMHDVTMAGGAGAGSWSSIAATSPSGPGVPACALPKGR